MPLDRKRQLLLLAGGILILAFIPFMLSGYWIRVLTGLFMYAALAEALNIVVGYAGYAAFGNAVFFGVGAYTTAILMSRYEWGFFAALVASVAVAGLYAFLLGWPVLRLRGHYFAIATIGVNMATMEVVSYLDFTGGGKGIALPIYPGDIVQQGLFFYYGMLILMIISVAVVWWIARSRLGYGLRAIRAEPEAAEVMGVNTTLYKVWAWTVSAAITGAAGSLQAYWYTFLEPIYVFDILISVTLFVMVLLGGAGTLWGPVIGAAFVEILSELVWSQFTLLHLAVLGALIVVVTIAMPDGFVGLYRRWRRGRRPTSGSVPPVAEELESSTAEKGVGG